MASAMIQSLRLPPTTHFKAIEQLHEIYQLKIKHNGYIPFTYPMTTYGAAILFLFFLIPPSSRLHCKFTRYLVFAVASAWHFFLIFYTRGYALPVTFGVGIIAAWGILWSAVLLVFNDAKRDFKRVKAIKAPTLASKGRTEGKEALQNGSYVKDCNELTMHYEWQSYPTEPFHERCEWVLDLLCNFRGVGWNWNIAVLPSRPARIEKDLNPKTTSQVNIKDTPVSRTGIVRYDEYRPFLIHNTWLFCKSYVGLDFFKVLVNQDPYFWGYVTYMPPNYLPGIIRHSAFLLRAYRLLLSMGVIWLTLRVIFALGPLILVGLVGDRYLGSNGQPWMYVDHYGSYLNVFNHGLAGWWGSWWHQTFRYAFQATGDWLVRQLRVKPKSTAAKVISLFVAFGLSGYLHGYGSMTMLGRSYPWSGMFVFFLLQPIGLLMEGAWRSFLKEAGLFPLIPHRLGQVCNFVYVHTWLYITAPLLTNDFARGGVCLFEPLPLSPLRAMGFGAESECIFCWGGKWLTWYTHPTYWWLSGIVL